jgi:hypothetical protein
MRRATLDTFLPESLFTEKVNLPDRALEVDFTIKDLFYQGFLILLDVLVISILGLPTFILPFTVSLVEVSLSEPGLGNLSKIMLLIIRFRLSEVADGQE